MKIAQVNKLFSNHYKNGVDSYRKVNYSDDKSIIDMILDKLMKMLSLRNPTYLDLRTIDSASNIHYQAAVKLAKIICARVDRYYQKALISEYKAYTLYVSKKHGYTVNIYKDKIYLYYDDISMCWFIPNSKPYAIYDIHQFYDTDSCKWKDNYFQ
jgi:hypothetical protein